MSRLESELEQAQKTKTRFDDRDAELARLRGNYEKLQTELLEIAKTKEGQDDKK